MDILPIRTILEWLLLGIAGIAVEWCIMSWFILINIQVYKTDTFISNTNREYDFLLLPHRIVYYWLSVG